MKVPLVSVRGLAKDYALRGGPLQRRRGTIRAVDGVDFDITLGETLGLVGESGCGKSTTGRSVLQLVKPTAGEVHLDGADLTALGPAELRRARRHMQMVFQDPYSSLNPYLSVRQIVAEPLDVHRIGGTHERRERVSELLELVGLSRDLGDRFPHQLSGGQRQRVGIARALATSPRFIVADEPVSALDVSVQAQVVNLLADVQRRLGLTYLLIAHDLAVVRHLSDRIAVMYLGRIVELAPRDEIFTRPRHPYTRALLAAIPIADPDRPLAFATAGLSGEPPDPAHPPSGCRFHPRCPLASARCSREDPVLRDFGSAAAPHHVACHHAEA